MFFLFSLVWKKTSIGSKIAQIDQCGEKNYDFVCSVLLHL